MVFFQKKIKIFFGKILDSDSFLIRVRFYPHSLGFSRYFRPISMFNLACQPSPAAGPALFKIYLRRAFTAVLIPVSGGLSAEVAQGGFASLANFNRAQKNRSLFGPVW